MTPGIPDRSGSRDAPASARRAILGVLGALGAVLAVATGAGLHGSSIGVWASLFPSASATSGVWWGRPKLVRADEYLFLTPAILSQAHQPVTFPRRNPALGGGDAPLLMNLPVRHWSTLFRPQHWGFFFLDAERAYAFLWNARTFLLVSGLFLLLMTLTGNRTGVSAFGAAWIFFSGYLQWWYSSAAGLPEMVGAWAFALVGAHHLALSPRRWGIAGAGLLLVVAAVDFALCLYPSWQVTLAYLGLAVLAGDLAPRLVRFGPGAHARFRAAVAGASVAATAAVLLAFYRDAQPTIEVMRATVAPGQRVAWGGGVSFAQAFSGYYGFLMSEAAFPGAWGNVCEASNFALLFPALVAALVARGVAGKRVATFEACLLAYLAATLVWLLAGWPPAVARWSGFSLVAGTRALLGLGLASVLWCCTWLAGGSDGGERLGGRAAAGASAAFLAFLIAHAFAFERATHGFAGAAQVALVCALWAAAAWLLLTRRLAALAALVLVPSAGVHGLVNPVTRGLGALTGSELFTAARPIAAGDPGARWIVYGPSGVADLLKAAGASVWNGTLIVPPLEDLAVLDPGGRRAHVYNRFAHVTLVSRTGPEIVFDAIGLPEDQYRIHVDPLHEAWRRLGVRYVVVEGPPRGTELAARAELVATAPERGWRIYRLR